VSQHSPVRGVEAEGGSSGAGTMSCRASGPGMRRAGCAPAVAGFRPRGSGTNNSDDACHVENRQGVVEQLTYLGIFAVRLLGSLGVPIPEEMAMIAPPPVAPRHDAASGRTHAIWDGGCWGSRQPNQGCFADSMP